MPLCTSDPDAAKMMHVQYLLWWERSSFLLALANIWLLVVVWNFKIWKMEKNSASLRIVWSPTPLWHGLILHIVRQSTITQWKQTIVKDIQDTCDVYTRHNVQGHKQENKSLSWATQEDPAVSKSSVSGVFLVTPTSELEIGRETWACKLGGWEIGNEAVKSSSDVPGRLCLLFTGSCRSVASHCMSGALEEPANSAAIKLGHWEACDDVRPALLSHYAFPELNVSCSNWQCCSVYQDALVQAIFSWLPSHVFPAPLPHCTFPVLKIWLPNWQQFSVWMDALVQAIFS